MDRASLRVLHLVSAERWRADDASLPALLRTLQARSDVHSDVIVLTGRDDVPQTHEARLTLIPDKRSLPRRLRAVEQCALPTPPHIVHAHGCRESLLGAWIAFRARGAMLRTVEDDSAHPAGWRGGLLRSVDPFCGRAHRNVVCASPRLGAQLARRHRELCVSVIAPGVEVKTLREQACRPVTEPMSGDQFHVALVGPFDPPRRLDMALATAYTLARDHPGRFCFHAFTDEQSLVTYAPFVERHRLTCCIRFHALPSPLAPWLARMNALLWCPDTDTVPSRVIEAMVLGVPVVAHAVGGVPELLGFGTYGTLVNQHWPQAYADALAGIAANPVQAAHRSKAAAEYATRAHDIARVADRYVSLYRSLGASRHGALDVCYL